MSKVSLYQHIKDHIVQGIGAGRWKPGDRLPSESELVVSFGVARMTVNRALRELADQGRVRRVAGVGSFVAEPRPQGTLLRIASIAADIQARGHVHECRVLAAQAAPLPAECALAMGMEVGESAFHSECVHLESGVPVQYEDRWVNPRQAPDFLAQDFSRVPPGDYLVAHVPYDEIEHVVDAVLPSREQARHLAMGRQEPCLLLQRRTWYQNETVTLVRCWHPASRYRLGSRFTV